MALLVAAFWACGSPREGTSPDDAVGSTTRDSAGIRVVESVTPIRDRAFELVGPTVAIGSIDGPPETAFGGVAGVSRLSDGRIAVVDRQSRELRAFGSDGSYAGTWAGPGEGPGELRLPFGLVRAGGDTLAIPDLLNRSFTRFSPTGEHVGTLSHPLPFRRAANQIAAQSCCIALGVAADGSAIWRYPQVWSTEGPGVRPTATTLVRIHPDGERLDTVGTYEAGLAAPWEGPNGVVRVNFSPRLTAAVRGDSIYLARGDVLGFTVMDLTGVPGRVARVVRARTPVTDEWLAGWRERERARLAGLPAERIRQIVDKTAADSLPAVTEILVSRDGHVWLSEWVDPSAWSDRERSFTYQVFDPAGVWLGTVTTPPGVWLREVGPDHVLGLRRGALDEEYVELYELTR